ADPARERRTLEHDDVVDDGHEIHDGAVLRLDQPVDPRRGKRSPQRRHGRNGVNDIAQGAQPDDEDVHRRRRASRSRVEWSLGSPTIATRPPYERTVSRSGTVSAL